MYKVPKFLLLCLFFISGSSLAEKRYENPQDIRRALESYLLEQLSAELPDARLVLEVQHIDERLRLSDCEHPLEMDRKGQYEMARLVTVKVSCHSPQTWSLYLSTEVARFLPIVAANVALTRGEHISADDLQIIEMDISQNSQGYFSDINEAVGMELRRSVRIGEALRSGQLRAPKMINRGDQVTLVARQGSLSVRTSAIALSDGRRGEQINVKNSGSENVVRAMVTEEGTVEISM